MLGVSLFFAGAAATVPAGLELGKGAIIGALFVGAAFLAGVAVLRRSPAAFCGLLMLLAGGALQAVWLGVFPGAPQTVTLLLGGVFAASALIFLSSVIGLAARSQLMGGLLFAGALSLAGIGVMNAALAGEVTGILKMAIGAAAVTVVALALFAGSKGDSAARLILPGALLAAAAPLLLGAASGAGVMSLAPPALFAIGILTASLVALADFSGARAATGFSSDLSSQFSADPAAPRPAFEREKALRVSENQLAQVLDYSGIAVLDWNRAGAHQSLSFAPQMGAEAGGVFTPDSMREFIDTRDVARFDSQVLGADEGDGGFDEIFRLQSGKRIRMRGARAVDSSGALERIVVFLDEAGSNAPPAKNEALKMAAASLTAAAANVASPTVAANDAKVRDEPKKQATTAKRDEGNSIAAAIDAGRIAAAFQPVISFDSGEACGAEALLRWPDAEKSESLNLTTEQIVREAERCGKGAKLTSIMLTATADHVARAISGGKKDYFGAFNVSLSQIRDADFVSDVKEAIASRKLPKGALVLELTEGERLADTPKIKDTFRALKAAGASLAYDDFGAGFSSLSNLHKHEFDYLKIDKSFIDDIVANGGKKKIVSALAKLGKEFGMTVIAEGIESAEAAETAKAIGCKMGQGYHLGEPAISEIAADVAPVEASLEATAAAEGGADVLLLDESFKASKASTGRVKRRLFSSSLR